MSNKNLLLIHGAWCSKKSFNYIVKKVLDDSKVGKIHAFEYDCQTQSVDQIQVSLNYKLDALSSNGLKTVVVGHSLGGLFALLLANKSSVSRTITLASPLYGTKYNTLLHWYLTYHAPIMTELLPGSRFLESIHSMPYEKPVDVLVATKGFNPMIYEPSDGVVSIASQTKWTPRTSKIYEIEANHSEILLVPETIIRIEKTLQE